MKNDSDYMRMALSLARRGLGRTWPNPSVGCVVIDDQGHVAGRGFTGIGGRPHAETIALERAGDAARGSTAYVTLEPCAHHGATPPCAEALARANVTRVVVATGDPDRRVSGRGVKILEKAGIKVDMGLCEREAQNVNAGFFNICARNKPLVTLKIASSQDNKIAAIPGQPTDITGPESRARGHLLRASHDAILVGIGTVLADNPSLTCRLPGLGDRSPVRIVLDSHLKIPDDCILVTTAKKIPTWVITLQTDSEKSRHLKNLGVKLMSCKSDEQGRVDMAQMMQILAQQGITRLLSEGGAQVNASLIAAGLIDRLYWFRSEQNIGPDGLDALADMKLEEVCGKLTLIGGGRCGPDSWQEYMK